MSIYTQWYVTVQRVRTTTVQINAESADHAEKLALEMDNVVSVDSVVWYDPEEEL